MAVVVWVNLLAVRASSVPLVRIRLARINRSNFTEWGLVSEEIPRLVSGSGKSAPFRRRAYISPNECSDAASHRSNVGPCSIRESELEIEVEYALEGYLKGKKLQTLPPDC